jgi:hypothetical protein
MPRHPAPLAWKDELGRPHPHDHPAQRRNDVWLALALLISAVISAWLGKVAGFYGENTPAFGWALVYVAALTLPLAVRRRFPELTLVVVALAFFVGVSVRIPEVYVGNVALFIAMYTVGAWVGHRRRATIVRLAVIVGMFVWLLVVMFQSAIDPDGDGPSRAGCSPLRGLHDHPVARERRLLRGRVLLR